MFPTLATHTPRISRITRGGTIAEGEYDSASASSVEVVASQRSNDPKSVRSQVMEYALRRLSAWQSFIRKSCILSDFREKELKNQRSLR